MSSQNQSPKSTNPSNFDEFDSIFKPVSNNSLELTTFPNLKDLPQDGPWAVVHSAYKRNSLEAYVIGLILKAVLSEQKQFFLLSKNLLIKYFQKDLPRRRKTLKGTENEKLMERLLARINNNEAFLSVVRAWKKGVKGESNEAAVYTISNNAIIEKIPWWNKDLQHEHPRVAPKESTPEYEYENESESDNKPKNKDTTVPIALGLDKKEYLTKLKKCLSDLKNNDKYARSMLHKYSGIYKTQFKSNLYYYRKNSSSEQRRNLAVIILQKEYHTIPIGYDSFETLTQYVDRLINEDLRNEQHG